VTATSGYEGADRCRDPAKGSEKLIWGFGLGFPVRLFLFGLVNYPDVRKLGCG
jgi:hypothetical protein